jgi:hypothetical protein
MDAHNISNQFKPIGIKLGMLWLGWHVFRHTHSSWLRQDSQASPSDQMAMLGHTDMRMTMKYGEQDLERRRGVVERMGAKLVSEHKLFIFGCRFWPRHGHGLLLMEENKVDISHEPQPSKPRAADSSPAAPTLTWQPLWLH